MMILSILRCIASTSEIAVRLPCQRVWTIDEQPGPKCCRERQSSGGKWLTSTLLASAASKGYELPWVRYVQMPLHWTPCLQLASIGMYACVPA